MSDLKDRLQGDLTAAMKARDELRTATLRMVLTAVKNEEVAGGAARELTDDEVVKVLAREGKKRREATEAYVTAGRQELADREVAEGASSSSTCPRSSPTRSSARWSRRPSPRSARRRRRSSAR